MIRCTFPDGTTEERPATSPALLNPDNPADIHARDPRKVAPSELSFLRDFTRSGNVYVWCLTGEADGALTGEWRRCHAETSAEQIERLTRERDAARAAGKVLARDAFALALAREVTRLVERYDNEPDYWTGDLGSDVLDLPELDAWRSR